MTDHSPSEILCWTARTGYAARGIVYLLVGCLILWAVWHGGSSTPSSQEALAALRDAPFGRIALYLVAAGLVAYAVWRIVQAIGDADDHGSDAKGLTIRTALLISGLIHVSLAWSALAIAGLDAAAGAGSSDNGAMTAKLMQQPWGRWLVGLVGAAIIGAGIAQGVRGYKASFMRRLTVGRQQLGALFNVCRFGLIARCVVFLIIGGLLILAAWRYDPDQEMGMQAAFNEIVQQPHGIALLGIVGAGMLAFSIYSFVQARYREVSA